MKNAYDLVKEKKFSLIRPLLEEAENLNISISVISYKNSLLKFERNDSFFYSSGDTLPFIKKYKPALVKNKDATKILLSEYGIKVPSGIRAKSIEESTKKIKEKKLSFPLILKPLDGLRAYGVTWNINSFEDLGKAIENFKISTKDIVSINSKYFIVEEQFKGDEFRVLILDDKVLACAQKLPATITGNGKSTIEALIKKFNKTRKNDFKIIIDDIVKQKLNEKKYTFSTILQANETFQLRDDMMLANGGRAIDRTKDVSPELEKICVTAAKAVGLQYAGIDLLLKTNGNTILTPDNYKIIEVNMFPGHILNESPLVENATVNVSAKILEFLLKQ